ncbi:hypothetical protein MHLP_01270 [Candidatus Mycoplasma haematolamae str. Purdue]|uniref:Ig-like domain-containing protein n=1 Tax=Mycoplasma haematolamae (strain Purdue) TaxID=1212765 RepID=I7CIY5_MYCHA|nr:hypothetical protein [Candidatus Mycoplasma haematolamae]AFO51834.1 hypothetical protein MHLP_01270 [Candidatus Mycoplasma haematolamae str. Purdue]
MTPKIALLTLIGLGATGGVTTAAVRSVDREREDVSTTTLSQTESASPSAQQDSDYEFEFPEGKTLKLTCPASFYPDNSLDYSDPNKPIIIVCKKTWPQPHIRWWGSDARSNTKKLNCLSEKVGINPFICTTENNVEVEVSNVTLSKWSSYASSSAIKII